MNLKVKTRRIAKNNFLSSSIILFFFFFAQYSSAQNQTISLSGKDMTIKAIFAEIEKQTNTSVDYDESIIDVGKKISATKSGTLSTVLDQTLKNTNCLYTIKGKHIVISPKPKGKENLIKTRGTVLDEKGDAVIGASVVVKGTNSGTVSDLDGQFELELDENAVLVISYLGYLPQDFAVEGNTFFSVNLREDTQFLDEVVVVGYGIQKKVNVIGSIAQIGSEKLENRATPMLSNALTGQMSGVTVVQRSGRPGESSGKIRVRGVGSFDDKDEYSSTKSDALVLIDGLPGDLNDINPEDVESISVLKDASTAAIYGSRAANGVILVTTKTGKEGKVSIAYNAYAGFNKATAFPEFVNSWEYATLMNEAQGREVYTAQDIQKYRDGSDLDNYANSKYLDEVFSENGFQTGHDLTLNGGSSSNRYLLSVGYLSQDGLVKKNNYERYNTRLNLVSDLLPNLKITTRLSGIYSMRNEPSVPGGIDADNVMGIAEYAVRFPGLHPTKLSNGTYGRGPKLQGTPRAWIDSDSFFENPNFKVNSNIRLDYTPIKDLQLSALGGYNYENQELKRYRSSFKLGNDITIGPSSLRHEMQKTIYKTFQATAQYGKSIQEHSFAALAGYSWEDQSYRTLVGFRDKFPGNDLPFLNAGSPDNQQSGGNAYEWAIQSLFGRLQYNYKERYLFESTVRYDGSSRFSKGEKYGFFPSLAAGWRMSEEAFIKDKENLNWISNLKIKASWGILGNQNIGNYPYQSVYQLGQNYPFGENYAQGAAITTAVDPSIRWEETQTIDGGLEGVFWNGLISTNISYFYRKTQDILYKPSGSVSSILGLRISEMNTGKLKNEGWEFELGHRNKIGNVSYNMNANFTIINNKLLSLGVGNVDQLNGMVGNGSNLFVGYPIDMYYGYQTDGVFLNQQDIDTWYDQSKINPKPQIGDIRYKDISGPDGVPDGKVDPNYDRVSLGSRIPQYTFGINIGADYKKFDLQLQFQGVSKVKGMLDTYAGWAFWSEGNIQRWQADGRFDPESPERNPAYPRLEDLGNMVGPNTQTSDFWTLDASYLRLKNVQVGYTLPKSVLKNMKIASLRFYMSSENPISWNKYRDGWDPEINTSGNYYPILATYTFGLNLKF